MGTPVSLSDAVRRHHSVADIFHAPTRAKATLHNNWRKEERGETIGIRRLQRKEGGHQSNGTFAPRVSPGKQPDGVVVVSGSHLGRRLSWPRVMNHQKEGEARLGYNSPHSRSRSSSGVAKASPISTTTFLVEEQDGEGGRKILHKSPSLDLSAWTEEVSTSGIMYNDNSSFDESKCASASSADDEDFGGGEGLREVDALQGEKGTSAARLYTRQGLYHHQPHHRIHQHYGGTAVSHASSRHRGAAGQVDVVTARVALWVDVGVVHPRAALPYYAPSPLPTSGGHLPQPERHHHLLDGDDDGGANASSDGAGSDRTPTPFCPSDEEKSNRGKSAPCSLKKTPIEDTEGPSVSGSSSVEWEVPPEEDRPVAGDGGDAEGADSDHGDKGDDDAVRTPPLRHHSIGHLSTVSSLSDGEHLKLFAVSSSFRDLLPDSAAAEKSTVAIGNSHSDEWDWGIHDRDDAAPCTSSAAPSTSVHPNEYGETIEILAPPGKLGIVIDTPDGELPIVHAVKKGSVLAGLVRVGDRLLAVDDDDVCLWTAVDISRLLAGKTASLTRRLTLLREPPHVPGGHHGGGADDDDDAFAQLGNSDRLLLDAALLLTENGAGDDDLILCALSQSLSALGGAPPPLRAEGSQLTPTSPSRSSKSDDIVVIPPPPTTTIPPVTVLSPAREDDPTLIEANGDGAPARHGRGRGRDRKTTSKTLPAEIKVATTPETAPESPSGKGTPTLTDKTQRRKRRKKKRRFLKERFEV